MYVVLYVKLTQKLRMLSSIPLWYFLFQNLTSNLLKHLIFMKSIDFPLVPTDIGNYHPSFIRLILQPNAVKDNTVKLQAQVKAKKVKTFLKKYLKIRHSVVASLLA